jgi:hypothetical protein
MIALGVQHEWLERRFPSPHEWCLLTRMNFRSMVWDETRADDDDEPVNWLLIALSYQNILRRLEDPNIDGVGLKEQDDGGILVAGVGRTGYDITGKSEPWRRGYHKVLMGCARAAEQVDGWVKDRTRNIAFPANVVRGPSNPKPHPILPGSPPAPKEEDCEPAFDAPETYYMRILTTRGFTDRQKLEAALGQASWLEYKGAPSAALEMYKWALDIATAASPNRETLFDSLGAINTNSGPVSSNVLTATTALAVHYARTSNLSTALPMFLSVLRARRSLAPENTAIPSTPTGGTSDEQDSFITRAAHFVRQTLAPPKYPPPPDDGSSPPTRSAKERCEEAAVMAYIGEILYTSSSGNAETGPLLSMSGASREDGLAWTREAVDVAEQELRGILSSGAGDKSQRGEEAATCRQCLKTGLENWATMVSRLVQEERESRERQREERNQSQSKISAWLGMGGSMGSERVDGEQRDKVQHVLGRWEAELQVVRERGARAAGLVSTAKSGGQTGWLFM